jgi:hypothetical protein
VDKARRVVLIEGARDIDIFRDDDAGRNVAAAQQLPAGGAQDGAQGRIDTGHRPVVRQRIVDAGIDVELRTDYARDDLAEEIGIRGQVLLALDLTAEHGRGEMAKRVLKRLPANIHLIERLHGGKAGCAALVGSTRCGG